VRDTDSYNESRPFSSVSFQMILSDLAKDAMTRSIMRSLCESWASWFKLPAFVYISETWIGFNWLLCCCMVKVLSSCSLLGLPSKYLVLVNNLIPGIVLILFCILCFWPSCSPFYQCRSYCYMFLVSTDWRAHCKATDNTVPQRLSEKWQKSLHVCFSFYSSSY